MVRKTPTSIRSPCPTRARVVAGALAVLLATPAVLLAAVLPAQASPLLSARQNPSAEGSNAEAPVAQEPSSADRPPARDVEAVLGLGQPPANSAGEQFRYRWKLSSFLGWLAGLFLPNRGEGTLTFEPIGPERIRGELRITSAQSKKGEYWSYEAQIDRDSGRTVSAGSSYFYKDKQRNRRSPIEGEGVFDIASAIYLLRKDPPAQSRRIEVWSDGKIYPVVIQPHGLERYKLGDREINARHFTLEAVAGSEDRWKGKLELWIADDEAATPVEIVVYRSGAAVRLRLEVSEQEDDG
jgi:hypothetical protein